MKHARKNSAWARTHGLIALTVVELGCAGGPRLMPMDPNRPLETEHGYQQGGRDVDPESVVNVLEREPRTAEAVGRARTLSTVSTVLAAAGGALVGWPVGEWAGGDPHPTWPAAYAGAGAVAVSIPLLIWAVSSMQSAVEAHNQRFGSYEKNGEAAE